MNERQTVPSLRRRDFLKVAAAGTVLLGTGGFRMPRSSLEMAQAAGAWLRASGRETPDGLTWPLAPGVADEEVFHLYSGTPGVILFLLELHHATGDEAYLRDAEAGARHLLSVSAEGPGGAQLPDWGLYTGLSGAAYTLSEVYQAGGDPSLGEGAERLVRRVLEAARPLEDGVGWFAEDATGASYDIISGSAGIGLTLLHFHERWGAAGGRGIGDEPSAAVGGLGKAELAAAALEVAQGAGRLLVARGRPERSGLKWPMSEAYPRLMPNFSHGTAGVAYFLARLYEVTREEAFLTPAVLGARYLEDVSACDAQGGCRIFHHEPGGEGLFYLGWCHGPVGTARLFVQLARVTGEDIESMLWVGQGKGGILHQGIPENRPEGYWNNVSQCCGDAGVGDFFLSLHHLTGSSDDLAFALHLGDYLRGEATEEGVGARWIQAENRTQPENVVAQTGWMQGAAGVGAFFLHLDGVEKGRKARIVFPDSPFRGLL
ncbi:MAG: lanthionine synthetase LanC family protein [Longimicrobiales bacterium]